MKKIFNRIVLALILILAIFGVCFGVYVSDYYHADTEVEQLLEDGIVSGEIVEENDWLTLPTNSNEIGFIFYPGAKVEYTSYLPLMDRFRDNNMNCFLVEMPFNLAFFGSNKAEEVIKAHPEIETWYIGGHSLGGAFASSNASENKDEIEGVVLLGAYLYGDYPEEQSITIYGSEDEILNRDKITYDTNVVVIEGGNHAQFGNYGVQDGDGIAAIDDVEQQEKTVELILERIEKR